MDEEQQRLNKETRAAWEANAAFWDEKMGEGNEFQSLLVGPAAERLLDIQPGELVLEIACGNGLFARRLASLGARVIATDFSEALIERARARTVENGDRIEYRLLDATDPAQLAELGEARFDAVVSNMALMDMAAIEPLFAAVPRLVRPGGRFVFTQTHPCFNHGGAKLVAEAGDDPQTGDWVTSYSVRVSRYKSVPPSRGVAMIGQPVLQYYFHRTLSELLGAAIRAGLVLDGIEEPSFQPGSGADRKVTWKNFDDIPPVLALRFSLNSSGR